jgi:hypothetical protein
MTIVAQTAIDFTGPEKPSSARKRQRHAERDRSLEALQRGRRRDVIALAHQVAVELATSNACSAPSWMIPNHCVTAPLVLEEMRRRGLLTAEDAADTRWIGGALPGGRGAKAKWVRVGYSPTASKGRVCAVWKMIEGARTP